MLYFNDKSKKFDCHICPHNCSIGAGETGYCQAYGVPIGPNGHGEGIVPLAYGRLTSIALDPVEKKPLYHFYPGSKILSVGSFGCNFRCPWCQNHTISMAGINDVETRTVAPEALADMAENQIPNGNIGVAFTYNEPLINFQYVHDAALALRKRGLKSVLVTNGYVNPEKLDEILPLIDAMNIDLKSASHDFYFKIGGDLNIVQKNIRTAAKNCHVELTCLLINGQNDSDHEMEHMTDFIASVSPETPFHISRFFPRFRMTDQEQTSLESMEKFARVARNKLRYVYLGNV